MVAVAVVLAQDKMELVELEVEEDQEALMEPPIVAAAAVEQLTLADQVVQVL
jgi:hypothetical protein